MWASQGTLASEIGISRKHCNVTMSALSDRGLIKRAGMRKLPNAKGGRVHMTQVWRLTVNPVTCVTSGNRGVLPQVTQRYPLEVLKKEFVKLDTKAMDKWIRYLTENHPGRLSADKDYRECAASLSALPPDKQDDCVQMGIDKRYQTLPVEWYHRQQDRPTAQAAQAYQAMIEALRSDTLHQLDTRTQRIIKQVYGDRHSLRSLSQWAIDSKRSQFLSAWK